MLCVTHAYMISTVNAAANKLQFGGKIKILFDVFDQSNFGVVRRLPCSIDRIYNCLGDLYLL